MIRGLVLSAFVGLAGCTGGGSGGLIGGGFTASGDGGCIGFCGDAGVALTVAEVQQIVAQAAFEASARGANSAVIAVADRVGNPLAVFQMGVTATTTPAGTVQLNTGLDPVAPFSGASLDNLTFTNNSPAGFNATGLAALSKAITAAYLSSEGNAFTTRTANQIVQESFNPGEGNQPGGPLFGVQFSQLVCSDLVSIVNNAGAATKAAGGGNIAPRASPLGLSADPGGIPLYKGGVPVGGIGVLADGVYGIDRNLFDLDITGTAALDEAIALAGTVGFQAPADRRADRITVDGKVFRFTDVENFNLLTNAASAPAFATINTAEAGVFGRLVNTGVQANASAFFSGATGVVAGRAFGQAASGVQAAAAVGAFTGQAQFAARDGFVLTNGAGTNRHPPTAFGGLTAAQVATLMASALDIANSARAQIRRPVNSQMRATISIVDANGVIRGIVRTRDGPVFGTDVSLQKARTATFFSSAGAAAALNGGRTGRGGGGANINANTFTRRVQLIQGTAEVQDHTPVGATALTDGKAFADRSGGNLARPFFPDGIQGRLPGPLSNPIAAWSPFATGLQLDLVFEELTRVLLANNAPSANCNTQNQIAGLQNGIQIFPGSVPLYNNAGALIGGIGVSGDGIDQDDMTAFLGAHNAGVLLGGLVQNAPTLIRADNIFIQPRLSPSGSAVGGTVNLRYVQCPQAPFLNSSQQDPCSGK